MTVRRPGFDSPDFIVWNRTQGTITAFLTDRTRAEEEASQMALQHPGNVIDVLPVGQAVATACQDRPVGPPVTKLD